MTDSHFRELERRFRASGSVVDEGAWLRARLQAGRLERSRLELATYCGHHAASEALGSSSVADPDLPLAEALSRWGLEAQVRASIASMRARESPRADCAVCGGTGWHNAGAAQGLSRLRPCECSRAGSLVRKAEAFVHLRPERLQRLEQTSGVLQFLDDVTLGSCPAIAQELVPWALGYRDPVGERVEARQREAAGE